jgi:predicted RNA-binding protein associated with RNAse of E/G family
MLTIESRLTTSKPTTAFGKIIADTGYLAIWFIFKNRWYDIGKFYDQSGKWLGYYCDIIQPVRKLLADQSRTVRLTDLYLDLWISAENGFLILDENELADAVEKRYLTEKMARRARDQLNILVEMIRSKEFPPKQVRQIEPLK